MKNHSVDQFSKMFLLKKIIISDLVIHALKRVRNSGYIIVSIAAETFYVMNYIFPMFSPRFFECLL